MGRRLVLVTGSPRSGTSFLAGMLGALGAHVPQPEIAADDSNPKGFSEPRWVVDYHNRLLKAVGVHVTDARPSAWAKTAEIGRDHRLQRELERWLRKELRRGTPVVVKDPRLVWFVPLWGRVAPSDGGVGFAIMLRHPVEVVQSLQTTYVPWHANSRVAGWCNAMLFGERATRAHARAFVRYDDLLADWMAALGAVCGDLDVDLVARASAREMRAANELVDPLLRRSRATWEELDVEPRLAELAESVWSTLERLRAGSGVEHASVRDDLDELRAGYVSLYRLGETMTQSTLFAAQNPGGGILRLHPRWSPEQPPLTLGTAAAKAAARVRRGARRRWHQVRRRSA